jgi:hypothetical protein
VCLCVCVFVCVWVCIIPQIGSPLHYSPFNLSVLFIVILTSLNILYLYLHRKYSNNIHLHYLLHLSFSSHCCSHLRVTCFEFLSFTVKVSVQWKFCIGILPVNLLLLHQSNPLQFNFSSLLPYPVFKSFQGVMFCLVSIQMWCMSLFFHLFPSIPHPWLSSSRSTFEYMLNVYLYVYMILLVIVLDLYTTYERKNAGFFFLNPATFTWKDVFLSHSLTCKWQNFILYGQIKYHIFWIFSSV